MESKKKITWLLYHEPVELFIRTANEFSKQIKQLTDNNIEIDIYTMDEYAEKFHGGAEFDPIGLIESGEVHMSQLQVSKIANWNTPNFQLFNLPFLFDSHEHATRALDGDIGKSMLADLVNTTPVRGLAFTYSGGYRVIAADKEIRSTEDLIGLSVLSRIDTVCADTTQVFGCNSVDVAPEDIKYYECNAVETTLPRYEVEANTEVHKHIINTKHSMYLTSIIISKDLWASLTAEEQESMQIAARNCAKLEREWSIADGDHIAANLSKFGILSMNEFDLTQTQKLKDLSGAVYEKYTPFFTPGLVESIRNA